LQLSLLFVVLPCLAVVTLGYLGQGQCPAASARIAAGKADLGIAEFRARNNRAKSTYILNRA
jgi:hypothetical protein